MGRRQRTGAGQQDDLAVIVDPLSYKSLYYQTYHRRPIVGYTSQKKVLPDDALDRTRAMFEAAEHLLDKTIRRDPDELGAALELLRKEKVGYIIQERPDGDRVILVK